MEVRARHALAALLCLVAGIAARPAHAADEIHWTLTGPTSVTFDWRGSESSIRYGLTSGYGSTAAAQTPSPLPYSSAGPFWEAKLTGIQPATTYHYSIGTGPDHLFRTVPAAGATFKVLVFGDVGDTATYSTVGAVQSLVAAEAPAFCLVVGDLTYGNDNGQACVDRHFNNVMKWSQDAAYMPAWGNHEWDKTTDDFRNYKGRFDFPNPQTSPGAPSAGCCSEDWYWFDYAGVRFIAYPEPYSGAWSDWNTKVTTLMDQAQSNSAIRYIVTYGHRPAYSSGYHSGDATLISYMNTLGASHSKYVLNLNGHSHNYERSYPQNGVTHITAGIGGSSLETVSGSCPYAGGCPAPSWSAYRAFHHGALRLTFSSSGIRGEAVCGPADADDDITCTSGSVFDSFNIGGPPPNTPPVVNAGGDQTVALASGASLAGAVSDDGLPNPPGIVTDAWSVVSGPGTVTFQDGSQPASHVGFSVVGTYVLKLTSSDSQLSTSDQVQITVQNTVPPIESRIAASTDDAEESAAGAMYVNSSDLELVYDGSNQWVGMRFAGLAIPRGSAITTAYIQFAAKEAQSEATTVTFHAQASDNAATFGTAAFNISSRPRTAASAPWSPVAWTVGDAGPNQRTPDLKAVIQEIVNRPGWASGNAIDIIVNGTGHRTAWAWDGNTVLAPLLHVEIGPATPVAVESHDAGRPVLGVESVWPNPARDEIRVAYSLGSSAPARLELMDVAGRAVLRQDLGAPGAGRFDARMTMARAVPPGIYWMRLTQAGRSVCSARVVLAR